YTWREIPIIFADRRVGKSKMSRTIFLEAFLWVLKTRLTGDRAVRQPPAPPRPTAQISSRQP
ncbi:MAG TPA: hypothetical protein VFQ25_04585, partial [Ktedonobacterales bacterium]|nr:hypothetical protein [Ktedonobacterales bacterium]